MSEGIKHDSGKVRMSLVPQQGIEAVARVRMYGVTKYTDPNSWKGVSPERYLDACLRHIGAHIKGEECDPESGLPHLDHAACNLAFIAALRDSHENAPGSHVPPQTDNDKGKG